MKFSITTKIAVLAIFLVLSTAVIVALLTGYGLSLDRRHVVIALAFYLAASVALAVFLSRLLVRPLVRITHAAREFGEGRFDAPLPPDRGDEIGVLARTFEKMAERVRMRSEELAASRRHVQGILESAPDAMIVVNRDGAIALANSPCRIMFGYEAEGLIGRPVETLIPERFRADHARHLIAYFRNPRARAMGLGMELYGSRRDGTEFPVEISLSPLESVDGLITVSTIRDITQRKQQERELIRAREEALSASQAKSLFLAQMSHEIRTPMHAIVGVAELLHRTPLTAEQAKYVQIFDRAGENLLNVLNDVLDVSKIEFGHMEIRRIPFVLTDVVERLTEMMAAQAKSRSLALRAVVADDVPRRVVGDPDRLSQIILNLLSNAIKFTQAGAIVLDIRCDPAGAGSRHALLFSVTDTGIGIPADKLDTIFESFSQVDGSATRQYGGTGLGLSISRQLVQLMGGRLWVRSTPGAGSTFYFTVRFAASPEEGTGAAARPGSADVAGGARALRAEEQLPQLGPLAILLAEDSEDNREILRAYLKDTPCRVTIARNGREAVDGFKAADFDIVLMDIEMPELDGFSAIREMRAWEAETGRPHRPMVALTAYVTEEDRVKSAAAGADMHLTKPIRSHELLQVLAALTSASQPPPASAADPRMRPILDAADPVLREKVPAYIGRRRRELAALRQALERDAFEEVRTAGHKLKGSAASYGMAELGALGAELEQAARAADAPAMAGCLARMETLLAGLRDDTNP